MKADALPLLRLPDRDWRARGRAHGEALRDRIAELVERWGDGLERIYGVDRAFYLERFAATTAFEATTRRRAPGIVAEVEGMAEGANLPFATLFAFQHVNEEFELGLRFAAEGRQSGGACSTIVVPPTAGRPSLVAQNLDLAEYLDGFQTMMRFPCADSDGEIMVLSVPGMISLNGMNSHGLALCDNTLGQLRGDPEGLPIFVLYRLLLEEESLAGALRLAEAEPHAAGLNWVMGDAEGVAMLERSGASWARHDPGPPSPAWHTNHPLRCDDWAEPFRGDSPPRPYRSSYLRMAALHQRLHGRSADGLDVATLQDLLRSRDDPDYPVCRTGGRNREDMEIGFTLAMSVWELRRGDPLWHIAPGPGDRTDSVTFRFD